MLYSLYQFSEIFEHLKHLNPYNNIVFFWKNQLLTFLKAKKYVGEVQIYLNRSDDEKDELPLRQIPHFTLLKNFYGLTPYNLIQRNDELLLLHNI